MTLSLSDYDGPPTQQSLGTDELPSFEHRSTSKASHLPTFVSLLAESDLAWPSSIISGPEHMNKLNIGTRGVPLASGRSFDVYGNGGLSQLRNVYRRQRRPDFLSFARELKVFLKEEIVSHTNVIRIHYWAYDYPSTDVSVIHPVLVMEKAIGSLKSFLGCKTQPIAVKHHLCLDIAEGLRHIHSCHIVHGDIKPDNILVVESKNRLVPVVAKLADFGAFIDLGMPTTTLFKYSMYAGTPGWKPPETCQEVTHVLPPSLLFKCDSFAYGLLVFSTFFKNGQLPFAPDRDEIWRHKGSMNMALIVVLQTRASELLSAEPSARPDVSAELLADESKTYRNWAASRKTLKVDPQPNPLSRKLRSWYYFWYKCDHELLSQLYKEYDVDTRNHGSSFSAATLLGMALSSSDRRTDGYHGQSLKFVQAAAETSCLAAKGMLVPISRACGSYLQPSLAVESDKRTEWLFEAAASGSLLALWELGRTSQSLEGQAWQAFREQGGYNAIPSPIGLSSLAQTLRSPNVPLTLYTAAACGTADDISRLVTSYNIDETNCEGQTALYRAAKAGNFETLQALVGFNANASITTPASQVSCLHWLFMFKAEVVDAVIQLLLSKSASLSARTHIKRQGNSARHILSEHFPFHWPIGTPFHWACFARSFSAMKALLQAGVHVDELNTESEEPAHTPLAMALFRGDAEVVEFLLQHGADATFVDGRGRNILNLFSMYTSENWLFRLPKSLLWWCYHGEQELHIKEMSKCVELVVKAGADVNALRGPLNQMTPLLDAVHLGEGGVALALLKEGADVSLRDPVTKRLPVEYWAATDGRVLAYPGIWEALLSLLLHHSAQCIAAGRLDKSVKVVNSAIDNPSTDHFKRAMQLILASQLREYVIPNKDSENNYLKHLLSQCGNDTVVRFEFLLECGEAVKLKEESIGDLVWFACINPSLCDQECLKVVQALLGGVEHDKRMHVISSLYDNQSMFCRNFHGTNVLMMAVLNAHLKTTKFLLQLGTDLQTLSAQGFSVLDLALYKAELLREFGLDSWSRHGPPGEPPRHRGDKKSRDPNLYSEMFWSSIRLRQDTYLNNDNVQHMKEKYFAIMDIVELIVKHGGTRTRGTLTRQGDANAVEASPWGKLYIAEEQPYYDMWKLLYDLDQSKLWSQPLAKLWRRRPRVLIWRYHRMLWISMIAICHNWLFGVRDRAETEPARYGKERISQSNKPRRWRWVRSTKLREKTRK